jgi:hypothetical protein
LTFPDFLYSVSPKVNTADEAFPFKINLMTPYLRRILTNKRHIFNYRLSRARKIVECAFDILTANFKIFRGQCAVKKKL